MVIRTTVRLAIALLCVYGGLAALSAALWWSFDSGPMAHEPRLVLTESSDSGAVRVYGDYPGAAAPDAARQTVGRLDESGGFNSAVLVVALPTGSGWVDPDQVLALEEWSGGDAATVSLRYSAAPSAAVFMLRPNVAVDSASALLAEVTQRLRALAPEERPVLVVHGQSLGAHAGALALSDPAIADAVDVVLWQGMPGPEHPEPSPVACTVTAVNPDDPVAALSWDLLGRPLEAVAVLADLPGSESATPGTRHSYLPLTPPDGPADAHSCGGRSTPR